MSTAKEIFNLLAEHTRTANEDHKKIMDLLLKGLKNDPNILPTEFRQEIYLKLLENRLGQLSVILQGIFSVIKADEKDTSNTDDFIPEELRSLNESLSKISVEEIQDILKDIE